MKMRFDIPECGPLHKQLDETSAAECIGIVDGVAMMVCDIQHVHAVLACCTVCGAENPTFTPVA